MTTAYPTEIVIRDPKGLKSHKHNLRAKAPAKKDVADLTASITAEGILSPLLITADDTIIAGHRRAVAAVAAGLTEVPCIVRDSFATGDEFAVRAMLAENVARRGLTAIEEAKGYEQLAAFGIEVGDIAASAGRDKVDVERAIRVAGTPKSAAITARYDLTMEQAIALSEFEDDKTALVDLTTVAKQDPGRFDHELARARDRHEARMAVEAETAKLTAQGITVLDTRPTYYDDKVVNLQRLAGSKAGKSMTTAEHKKCPGHAAFVEWENWRGKTTAAFFCTDAKKYGHKSDRPSQYGSASLGLSDEEKARRSKARQDAAAFHVATKVRLEFARRLFDSTIETRLQPTIWKLLIHAAARSAVIPMRNDEKVAFEAVTGLTKTGTAYSHTGTWELLDQERTERLVNIAFALVATQGEFHSSHRAIERTYFDLLVDAGYAPADVETELMKTPASHAADAPEADEDLDDDLSATEDSDD